jgi:hypothetical protein
VKPRLLIVSLLWVGLVPALAAQGPTAPAGYPGVRPGSGNPPPAEDVARARAAHGERLVTWPGFQMLADGRSQFFLQMSGPVRVTERRAAGRFELVLTNTSTHLRNTRRPLETRFFNTPVTRATVKRRGRKDLVVLFELRMHVTPDVRTEARDDGYQYVLVTFPAGQYVDGPAAAPASAEAGEVALPDDEQPDPSPPPPSERGTSGPPRQASDPERPPVIRR